MVSDTAIGIMFFQDSRVAVDNKNNRSQKSMPKIKMAAMDRKYIYNTCIFGCIRNSNDIPTAIPMFLRSGNTTRVLIRITDVRICEKSKMAAINRKYI